MSKPLPAADAARLIPSHWTPEQALAAWECLQAVREALWALYGPQMQQAWVKQLETASPAPDFDPDAPF